MKIKLDENIPARLIPILVSLGHPTDTVHQEGLTGKPDPRVIKTARNENRFFITQDLDFSDARQLPSSGHPGILLVRLRNPDREEVYQKLKTLFETEDATQWQGNLVVVTDSKIRVYRPKH